MGVVEDGNTIPRNSHKSRLAHEPITQLTQSNLSPSSSWRCILSFPNFTSFSPERGDFQPLNGKELIPFCFAGRGRYVRNGREVGE